MKKVYISFVLLLSAMPAYGMLGKYLARKKDLHVPGLAEIEIHGINAENNIDNIIAGIAQAVNNHCEESFNSEDFKQFRTKSTYVNSRGDHLSTAEDVSKTSYSLSIKTLIAEYQATKMHDELRDVMKELGVRVPIHNKGKKIVGFTDIDENTQLNLRAWVYKKNESYWDTIPVKRIIEAVAHDCEKPNCMDYTFPFYARSSDCIYKTSTSEKLIEDVLAEHALPGFDTCAGMSVRPKDFTPRYYEPTQETFERLANFNRFLNGLPLFEELNEADAIKYMLKQKAESCLKNVRRNVIESSKHEQSLAIENGNRAQLMALSMFPSAIITGYLYTQYGFDKPWLLAGSATACGLSALLGREFTWRARVHDSYSRKFEAINPSLNIKK